MKRLPVNVLTLVERAGSTPAAAPATVRVELVSISEAGQLLVRDAAGREWSCDWLDTGPAPALQSGDTLLALVGDAGAPDLVMGRVGRYVRPLAPPHITLEAEQTLSLKCGEASIDLRADGKVIIRGDDVLVRAKGTQRIRAGSVSIN